MVSGDHDSIANSPFYTCKPQLSLSYISFPDLLFTIYCTEGSQIPYNIKIKTLLSPQIIIFFVSCITLYWLQKWNTLQTSPSASFRKMLFPKEVQSRRIKLLPLIPSGLVHLIQLHSRRLLRSRETSTPTWRPQEVDTRSSLFFEGK